MPSKPKQTATTAKVKSKYPAVSRKQGREIVELRGTDIFQVEGSLTTAESAAFISFAENLGFQHQGSRGAAFGEAFRNNGRTAVNSKELADTLWQNTGLKEAFAEYPVDGKQAVGLNPNLRFYKYVVRDKFGRHVDDSVKVGNKETKYTLLIYLSGSQDGLLGGETLFYGEDPVLKIPPADCDLQVYA